MISKSAVAVIIVVGLLSLFAYSVYNHYLILNGCYGKSLFVSSSQEYCVPDSVNAVVVNDSIYASNFQFLNSKPFLTIWTENMSEPGNRYLFSGIPDTFAVHMSYASNVSLEAMIMTNQQYVKWAVSNETLNEYTFMIKGHNASFWFNQSEGCGAYVMVIKSENNVPFWIAPDEQALYDPSSNTTGACV